MGQSAAHENKNKKRSVANLFQENVSPDNVFLFETLHITQKTYLFDTSCYFVIYQQFFSTMPCLQYTVTSWPQVKLKLRFFACVVHSTRPLRKQGLFSSGLKGHVCTLVDFDPCCLTTNFLGMYCYFPVI